MDVAAPQKLLTGLTVDELSLMLGSRSRAFEVVRWLTAGALPQALPAELPGVQRRAWERLCQEVGLPEVELLHTTHADDGTRKLALRVGGVAVETVLIPAEGRTTVCVSSQAGCTRNCGFCATATLGFNRNLRAGEIVAQYLVARALAPAEAPARNVVFMGMGEPMDNLDEVLQAIRVLTQSPAPQLSHQHLTVSTSGVLPGMQRFLRESKAKLALSVNASSDAQRLLYMPQTRSWPLQALMDELREDKARNPRRIHFMEYVMFSGVNDSDEDARRLVELLEGVHARVNLIPHNAFEGSPYRPSTDERLLAFQARVIAAGVSCYIRWSRGRDVAAACGQLALGVTPAVERGVGWRTLGR
jgi:23S rRNA (adenine2503-C2)-methyltransferase